MARLLYKNSKATQKGVDIIISDGWLAFMKGDFHKNAEFWKIVDKYFRKAMVLVENQIRANATAMSAVATGFMRAHTASRVVVDMGKKTPIMAEVGTMAWYDILIEKGLGRHSATGVVPAKYHPTAEQLAIVPTSKQSKAYWKKSPKVPRPFITMAAKQTRSQVVKMISQGFRMAYKKMNAKYGKQPKHSLKALAGSAPRLG